MSRFGPTRGELKLRLAISLLGLGLLTGAYAFNGIGGIASLEIGIIGAAFFRRIGDLVGPPPLANEGNGHMSGATIIQLTLFALVFPGLGLASGPDDHASAIARRRRRGNRPLVPQPRGSPRPQHAAVPDLRAGRDAVHADRPAARLTPFAPRAARLDRADGASRLPPPGHAAVGDPRRPRDRAGRQARRPSVGSGQGGASGRLPAGPRSGGLSRGASRPPARHGHLRRDGLRAHALGPAPSRPPIRTPPREKDLPRPRLGRDGGKEPARSTCRSLSTGPTGRCNT